MCLQGAEFNYNDKGAAIPPSKEHVPDQAQYREIEASHNAHVIQDAPEGYNQ